MRLKECRDEVKYIELPYLFSISSCVLSLIFPSCDDFPSSLAPLPPLITAVAVTQTATASFIHLIQHPTCHHPSHAIWLILLILFVQLHPSHPSRPYLISLHWASLYTYITSLIPPSQPCHHFSVALVSFCLSILHHIFLLHPTQAHIFAPYSFAYTTAIEISRSHRL